MERSRKNVNRYLSTAGYELLPAVPEPRSMPTFIDESGDTGPVANGGKPYFRMAAVHFSSFEAADLFRVSVKALRSQLGLRADYEFKFHSTESYPERRRAFYEVAASHPIRFAVCSINKTAGRWASVDGRELQWACATCLASSLRMVYLETEANRLLAAGKAKPLREAVIVDENNDGSFLKIVKKAFRGLPSGVKAQASLVGDVTFRESGPEPGLYLPDMIVGAFGASLDGDAQWYRMMSDLCINVMQLP